MFHSKNLVYQVPGSPLTGHVKSRVWELLLSPVNLLLLPLLCSKWITSSLTHFLINEHQKRMEKGKKHKNTVFFFDWATGNNKWSLWVWMSLIKCYPCFDCLRFTGRGLKLSSWFFSKGTFFSNFVLVKTLQENLDFHGTSQSTSRLGHYAKRSIKSKKERLLKMSAWNTTTTVPRLLRHTGLSCCLTGFYHFHEKDKKASVKSIYSTDGAANFKKDQKLMIDDWTNRRLLC